uniref:Uncharacterized protein n=1 Tax=Anguilla anguilla TaxID=7936 RepID=A0A0E9PFT3_ANGAN
MFFRKIPLINIKASMMLQFIFGTTTMYFKIPKSKYF